MKKEQKHYETILVFRPSLTEVQLKDEIKKFETLVAQNKGTDVAVDNWGRREIAYYSKKEKVGTYVAVTYATLSETLISDLNSALRISETVLKFQTHRTKLPPRKFRGNPRRAAALGDEEFGEAGEVAEAAF